MTYELEDGVPKPPSRRGGRASIYPFRAMEVGQSFFAPGKTPGHMSSAWGTKQIRALGRKFTSQRSIENGIEGTRVWRIK